MSDARVASQIAAAPSRLRRLPRSVGFGLAVSILLLFQAAASALTPLFVVYQRQFGFSSATITLIFAIFVFGLLCTLLIVGGLSDHVGRRPVLLAGLGLEAVALLLFLLADGVTMLMIARLVQGVATGMVLPALGATLVDFNPPHAPGRASVVNGVAPIGGLAFGSLFCGALVQYGPDPTHFVWELLLASAVLAFVAILLLEESSARQGRPMRSLQPRLGVPHQLRTDVYALIPIIVASWALGGLYLSLGPSAAQSIFGISDHFVGGLVATLLCGTGALSAYTLRKSPGTPLVLRLSVTLLPAGTTLTLVGTLTHTIGYSIAGTLVAGIGYGASGLATFGMLAKLAGPIDSAKRGELFAVAYTAAYLSFSLPALIAGYAATHLGLYTTIIAYSIAVILIALAAFAVQEARLARR